MPIVVEEPVLVAVRDVIRAIPGFFGCEIGETPASAADEDAPGTPYAIIYPIPWETYGPPMTPGADAPVSFQVTTVGLTGQQALFNAGRIRRELVDLDPATGDYVTAITIPVAVGEPAMAIMARACTTAGALEPDPRVQSAIDRFVFFVTTS